MRLGGIERRDVAREKFSQILSDSIRDFLRALVPEFPQLLFSQLDIRWLDLAAVDLNKRPVRFSQNSINRCRLDDFSAVAACQHLMID